jgi:hypothetical protein
MVKMWAEKEMRNLKRINQAGIVSPLPLLLRSHVLVMEFFGADGSAAPRLKVSHCLSSNVQLADRDSPPCARLTCIVQLTCVDMGGCFMRWCGPLVVLAVSRMPPYPRTPHNVPLSRW